MKISTAGGDPTELASRQDNPFGIALSPTKVYWTNADVNGAVMELPLEGGTPVPLPSLATHLSVPKADPGPIAVDEQNVYWAAQPGIWSESIQGGVPTDLWPGLASSIVADNGYVYWTDVTADFSLSGCSAVIKMPASGGAPIAIATGLLDPLRLALDAVNAYWTTSPGTVESAPLQGGSPVFAFPSDARPAAPGPPRLLAEKQNTPVGIAVEGADLYWVNAGSATGNDGAVMKLSLGTTSDR